MIQDTMRFSSNELEGSSERLALEVAHRHALNPGRWIKNAVSL